MAILGDYLKAKFGSLDRIDLLFTLMLEKEEWFSVIPCKKIKPSPPLTFSACVGRQTYTALDQLKFWPIYFSGIDPNFHQWKWNQIHFVFNKARSDKQVSS